MSVETSEIIEHAPTHFIRPIHHSCTKLVEWWLKPLLFSLRRFVFSKLYWLYEANQLRYVLLSSYCRLHARDSSIIFDRSTCVYVCVWVFFSRTRRLLNQLKRSFQRVDILAKQQRWSSIEFIIYGNSRVGCDDCGFIKWCCAASVGRIRFVNAKDVIVSKLVFLWFYTVEHVFLKSGLNNVNYKKCNLKQSQKESSFKSTKLDKVKHRGKENCCEYFASYWSKIVLNIKRKVEKKMKIRH